MNDLTKQGELVCDFCHAAATVNDKECWNCGNEVFVYE